MRVFISWSGDTSKAVATALRDWLPKVIQSVKPWMSAHDIPKGTRWLNHIGEQLEQIKTGIVCLTPDNLNSPWILFEAGALAKTLADTYVCPYLFRLADSSVEWPLAQFQLSQADKDDTKKLVATINTTADDSQLSESHLNEAFEKWWPDLEKTLSAIPQKAIHSIERNERQLLEDVLTIVRQLSWNTRHFDFVVPELEMQRRLAEKTKEAFKLFGLPEQSTSGFLEAAEAAREEQRQIQREIDLESKKSRRRPQPKK
jgi:hypothetical protein